MEPDFGSLGMENFSFEMRVYVSEIPMEILHIQSKTLLSSVLSRTSFGQHVTNVLDSFRTDTEAISGKNSLCLMSPRLENLSLGELSLRAVSNISLGGAAASQPCPVRIWTQ